MFSKITWMMLPLIVMALLFTACGGGEQVEERDEPAPVLALPEHEPGPGPELAEMTEAEAAEPGQITDPSDQELLIQGERLYRDNCAACHRLNGEGQGRLYPALNNNPFVTNQSPLPVISTVLHGRGAMPSFRNAFSERQVAAVVSYIRNAWNNDASIVGLDEVGPAQEMAAQEEQPAAEEEAAAAPTPEATAEAGEGEQADGEEAAPEPTAEEGEQADAEEATPEATAGAGEGEQADAEEATPEATAGEAEDGADAEELISQGEQVYTANCAACHGPEGQGGGVFPALAGSELLTGDPTGAIQVVVHGRGAMPAFGGTLSNEQIAAVLSYERNSWGNEAEIIAPEQVAQAAEGSE
jgi:cytochrome c oxidase subunit II